MNSKNDSKLRVINNHTSNKNKSQLSKQLEQEQNEETRIQKKMRKGLGTSGTTLNIPTSES